MAFRIENIPGRNMISSNFPQTFTGEYVGGPRQAKAELPFEGISFAPEGKKIKSDGGATDYYKLPSHATELRHLISAKAMSKSRGDVFKACYRLGEKEGNDLMYELNKMAFFIQDMKEMLARGEHI